MIPRLLALAACLTTAAAHAQVRYPLPYPPKLPGEKRIVTDRSKAFLKPGPNLREGVEIARTPPTVDFGFYPNQDYPGNPWSFRAVGTVRGDKFYSALCDHLPVGTAYLFEYDAKQKTFRLLANTAKHLREDGQITPEMKYAPGEVQTRIDFGKDGWLYYATTRGSTRVTTDENGYRGDWVLRTNPKTGTTETVYAHPVPKHCYPAGVLDPERMIFYGGTAAGDFRVKDVRFFAVDVRKRKLLKTAKNGFDRYAIFAKSTGNLYWEGRKYDPETNAITPCEQVPHVRSATQETPQGKVYGTSHRKAQLWAFDVRTEEVSPVGQGAVASQTYVAAVHADPAGRYLYYVPGAHGGASQDGSPIVQYDLETKTRKVLCFLHPYYQQKYGYTLDGCFCSVLSPEGDKLYVSWDGWRDGQPRGWESAALTVVHIPESERQP